MDLIMAKARKFFYMLGGTVLGLFILRWTGLLAFDYRMILSISIFSMFIFGTLLFGEFRLAFAFGGIALLMGCGLITVERFTQSASLDVLVFLIGTFLVIGFLEESQFFEHVISAIVGFIGPKPQTLLLVLMMMAAISSALVGEVTAILFMAGAMLHLTNKYRLNPVPFIIMLVFASNNGSAMSSVGNPIGVLIALKTGLSFVDFLCWAAPVAIAVNVVTYIICRWWYADAFAGFAAAVKEEFTARAARAARPIAVGAGSAGAENGSDESDEERPLPASGPLLSTEFFDGADTDTVGDLSARGTFWLCWAILGGLVAMLVTHRVTERLLHLREGTMMVAAALTMGCIVLFIRREKARELVERRVDWWTLAFFMMLFASVGTLQDTHVTKVIADRLNGIGGSNHTLVIQIVGWATGWLSAFLDNVLAVATFMPVVHDIRMNAAVPYESSIYWFMLFGGTFMGNMTVIGSTANIVAVGLLEKRGHGTVPFGQWMKIGFIVSIASMVVATGMLEVAKRTLPLPVLPVPTHVEAATQ
jgi:Na+/H+ antiporter NhaD/arsenite permease-like protein